MTLVARERLESRTKQVTSAGKVTGKRMFIVFDDAGASVTVEDAITTVAAGNADFDGVVYGSIHPDDPELIAIRIGEGHRVDGHNDLVELPWFYENVVPIPPGQGRPGEVGFVDEQADQRRELVKLYRIQPDLIFPPEGNVTVPGKAGETNWFTQDVDGTPNDIRGFRETALLYRSSLSITEIVDVPPSGAAYGFFAGKRNSEIFFGGAIGKIVYAGAKSRSVGLNKSAVTHEFFYDEWFHLVQIADRDQDGHIDIQTFEPDPPGTTPLAVARSVFWRQPFPELADLSQISDYF